MHELTEWKSRNDDLISSSLFLTVEEVKEARKESSIKIEFSDS